MTLLEEKGQGTEGHKGQGTGPAGDRGQPLPGSARAAGCPPSRAGAEPQGLPSGALPSPSSHRCSLAPHSQLLNVPSGQQRSGSTLLARGGQSTGMGLRPAVPPTVTPLQQPMVPIDSALSTSPALTALRSGLWRVSSSTAAPQGDSGCRREGQFGSKSIPL